MHLLLPDDGLVSHAALPCILGQEEQVSRAAWAVLLAHRKFGYTESRTDPSR